MATVTLQATPRTGLGKEKARKLRQAELIPAIIYGHATEPTPVTITELDFRAAMSTSAGSRAVIRLDIEGESSTKVSSASMAEMSEICCTSSSAAARGSTFLPDVVAAAMTWL